MIVIIILLLEVATFFVVGFLYMGKLIRFGREGTEIKQPILRQWGHMLALAGIIIGIGLPNVLGIQNDFSNNANTIYLLVTTAGTLILVIGWRFIIASYRTKAETPNWIKTIARLW